MRQEWSPEDLIGCWTLVEDDWRLLGNKSGATRLGFALEDQRPEVRRQALTDCCYPADTRQSVIQLRYPDGPSRTISGHWSSPAYTSDGVDHIGGDIVQCSAA